MTAFLRLKGLLRNTRGARHSKRRFPLRRTRALSLESLERRELLAITVSAWADDWIASESLDANGQ